MSETQLSEPSQSSSDPRLPTVNPLEQATKLRELAATARTLIQTRRDLEAAGFVPDARYFIEQESHVVRVDDHVAGGIRYHTRVEAPLALIESIKGTEDFPADAIWQNEYQRAKLESILGAIRFTCGQLWYTAKEPWTPERLSEVRRDLGLPEAASYQQVERHLHFHFQRLYRKPPDDWSDAETIKWERLESYIDLEAYKADNPPTNNRSGRILYIDADKFVVLWNDGEELSYDPRLVPAELLDTPEGWIIHAEFRVRNGAELWLSSRAEPPLLTDEEVMAADIAAEKSSPAPLPTAEWPKTEA